MPKAAGLYYTRSEGGNSTKKPVVLIHGAGLNHACWPVELRRLNGRITLGLDLPGHGRSSGVGLQSVEAYCAEVISFLAELGMYQAVFIGHSLGGAIALQLALDFSPHVAGLGLICSGASFNLPAELLTRMSSAYSYSAGLQLLKKSSFAAATSQTVVEKGASILSAARTSVLYGDWKACAQFDRRKQAGQIRMPVYIACGQEDQFAPPAVARFLAAHLPASTLDILPNAGHMAILEQPQRIARGLSEFLTTLDGLDDQISLKIPLPTEKQVSSRLQNNGRGKE